MRVTRGTIVKRGARFWVDYQIQGKRIREPLTDPSGNPVTDAKTAKVAADRILRPYTAKSEAERRRLAAGAMLSAIEVAAAAEVAARPRLPLAEVWTRHPYEVNTRGTTERRLSASSVRDFKALWEHFTGWAESRGIRNAEDVTHAHAEDFRRELGKSALSADRVNKVFLTARAMFRAAKIAPNPFDGFRKLAHKANGRRELTEPELRAVCGSAVGELRTLYAIGLYTGLRLGDACRLDWAEVAPDLSRIIREPAKTSYKGTELVIPVHPVLGAILAETPPPQRSGPVLPETADAYGVTGAKVARRVGKHFEDHGIRLHKPGTGEGTGHRAAVEVGFHSLRHSFVSLAARHGVPLHVIQALCGHSTPAVQRLYLHNTEADTRRAIDSIPSMDGAKALPAAVEPERAELHLLVDALPIETIKAMLAAAKGGAK
jgi:integrase